MPITVPYPNMTGAGAAQPMLVKVEVVGAPGTQSHVTHAQLMPQTMTYNVAGTTYNPGQVSYATQPFSMQVASQPQVAPPPPPSPSSRRQARCEWTVSGRRFSGENLSNPL